jgi:hypothetical protein
MIVAVASHSWMWQRRKGTVVEHDDHDEVERVREWNGRLSSVTPRW